ASALARSRSVKAMKLSPYLAGAFNDLLKLIQHIVQLAQTEAVVRPKFGRPAGTIEDEREVCQTARPSACVWRAHDADALHALKSASETVGSFLRKATIDQISGSGVPIAPKLGMPVILMPFLTTQNSWRGCAAPTTSLRSGGAGLRPSENFAHSAPGAPWHPTQPRSLKARAP